MHKKSIEASQKMNEDPDDEDINTDSNDACKHKDELKSESIAALRAKAQEHSARLLQAATKDTEQSDRGGHAVNGSTKPPPFHGSGDIVRPAQ